MVWIYFYPLILRLYCQETNDAQIIAWYFYLSQQQLWFLIRSLSVSLQLLLLIRLNFCRDVFNPWWSGPSPWKKNLLLNGYAYFYAHLGSQPPVSDSQSMEMSYLPGRLVVHFRFLSVLSSLSGSSSSLPTHLWRRRLLFIVSVRMSPYRQTVL